MRENQLFEHQYDFGVGLLVSFCAVMLCQYTPNATLNTTTEDIGAQRQPVSSRIFKADR